MFSLIFRKLCSSYLHFLIVLFIIMVVQFYSPSVLVLLDYAQFTDFFFSGWQKQVAPAVGPDAGLLTLGSFTSLSVPEKGGPRLQWGQGHQAHYAKLKHGFFLLLIPRSKKVISIKTYSASYALWSCCSVADTKHSGENLMQSLLPGSFSELRLH